MGDWGVRIQNGNEYLKLNMNFCPTLTSPVTRTTLPIILIIKSNKSQFKNDDSSPQRTPEDTPLKWIWLKSRWICKHL